MKEKSKQEKESLEKYSDMMVKLITTRGHAAHRAMKGRALVLPTEGELIFQETTPRGPRSVEVGRTGHCRLVRRPDGDYTLTFRVNAGLKYMSSQLVAEVRTIASMIEADAAKERRKG